MNFIPIINEDGFEEVYKKTIFLHQAGYLVAHLDVMDGKFVKKIRGCHPKVLENAPIKFIVHLMAENPLVHLAEWGFVKSIADVIVHVEAMSSADWQNAPEQISVALKVGTPIDVILPYLPKIKQVLFLGVDLGDSGQGFNDAVLEKISILKKLARRGIIFSIDGGVNDQTISDMKNAGVDVFHASSFFWKDPEKAKNFFANK